MAGFGAYGNNLGKTKMDDTETQYYQPSAKKTKVDYTEGSWQQPDGYTDYSSYYSMYTDPQQQQQQSQQQIQQQQIQQPVQTQQTTASAYTQGGYNPGQYAYGAYGSYYNQEATSAPPATYECPLYDKTNNGGYYDNSQQPQSNNYNSNIDQGESTGYSTVSQDSGQSSQSYRGNRGNSNMSGNRGNSNMGNNRSRSTMGGNRGGSSMGGNQGGSSMGGNQGGSSMGGNQGGSTMGDNRGSPTIGGSRVGSAMGGSTMGGNRGGLIMGGNRGGPIMGGNRGGSSMGGSLVGGNRGGPSMGGNRDGSTMGGNRDGSTIGGNPGGSSMGGNRGGSSMGGNRGGSTMGGYRGGLTMGANRGGLARGGSTVSRGFYDDGFGSDSRGPGRFTGSSRGGGGSRGGSRGAGSILRGSGNINRGRGRGRGGSNQANGGDAGKWETLPGGKSRTTDKKVQPAPSMPKADTVDASKLPLPEKLQKLCLFLINEKRDVNEIMLFENSLMSCKLGIKPDFMIDSMVQGKNGSFFTGRLILDGIFLSRAIGSNKKHIKLTCFKKAVEMCRTLTVSNIMSQKDMTPDALKEKLENLNSAVTKVEKEVLEELPTVQIVKKLQDVLTNPKYTPTNAISNMELAASVSKCRVRCRYDSDTAQLTSGKTFYKGFYYIDNVLQGVGVSLSKKTAKSNCYNMVVQRLTTSKAEDILSGVYSEILDKAVTELNASVKITPKSFKSVDLREKFSKLKELLETSDLTPNICSAMDMMFNDVKLTPVCLFRRVKQEEQPNEMHILCNLYLAGRLIAIGESPNRKDSQVNAYTKSKEILLSADPEFIITQHIKLQPHDQAAPDVIDFRVKGNCVLKNNCTNFYRLQRTKQKVASTPVKDLIIYEHASWSSDRKVQGFCILQHSCFLNNMLLEWEFFDDDTKVFRCEMKIQKEHISSNQAKSISKIGSRNLAAADILFKLYETHPVVQISTYAKFDPSTKIISFEEVLTEAKELETLAKEAGEIVEDVEMTTSQEEESIADIASEEKTSTDGEVEMQEETPGKDGKKPQIKYKKSRNIEKFIIEVVKKKLDEFTSVRTLEDLLFGPTYPHNIARQINGVLRNLEVPVRFMSRTIRNEMYTIVTQNMAPAEMAAFLKGNGGVSGRFRLVNSSELPSHKDIEPELNSGEIKISKQKSNSDNFFDDVSLESNTEFHTAMSSTLGDNSSYTSTCDVTMKSADSSLITPKKEKLVDTSLPSTPLQGNTSTPKQQSMTSTPVGGNTSFKKPNFK